MNGRQKVTHPRAWMHLGVDPRRIPCGDLTELKANAHRRFTELARDLHPDVNGGDERKTEAFKVLANANDEIEAIQERHARPRQQFVPMGGVVVVFTGGGIPGGGFTWTTSGNDTTGGGSGWPW